MNKRRFYLPSLLLLLTVIHSLAGDITWTNTAGGNWTTAANWSPNAVPGVGDAALINSSGNYTVTLDANVTVTVLGVGGVSGMQTLDVSSRTLTLNTACVIGSHGVLALNAGTLAGNGTVFNQGTMNPSQSTINAPLVNQGQLLAQNNNTFGGAFENQAGAMLKLSTVGGGLTVANGFTNSGTIEMTTAVNVGLVLTVNSGSLVNAPGGQINVLQGAGGTRELQAQLNNQGTLTVNQALTITKPAVAHTNSGTITLSGGDLSVFQFSGETKFTFTTTGTIDIPSGRTFSVENGTLNYNGGTMGGAGTVSLSTVTATFIPDFVIQPTTLLLFTTTLNGGKLTNPAGRTFTPSQSTINAALVNQGVVESLNNNILNGPFENQAGALLKLSHLGGNLTVLNGFTNSGTIEMTTTVNVGLVLTVNSGNLVNAPGGQINVLAGAGGTRELQAQLNNQGTLTANQALTLNKASAAHVNSGTSMLSGGDLSVIQFGGGPAFTLTTTGTIDIGSGRTFTVSGGSIFNNSPGILNGNGTLDVSSGAFSNASMVSPGASPGRLTIIGSFPQTANGALNIELAGNNPGTDFDVLAVTGAASLNGALNVTLTNGFLPASGATFVFLTNSSRSGAFTTFNYPSNPLGLAINYTATNAALQVVNRPPVIAAIADQTTNELTLFTLAVSATDADVPAQTFSYSLLNAPAGASMNASGVITWTPDETQGPGTHPFIVRVADSGLNNLAATQSFNVIVREVNVPPLATGPGNQVVNELATLNATATFTDADVPANSMTLELLSGPPGLTFNPATGQISWTPTEAQGPDVVNVQIVATDTNLSAVNATSLRATNTFTITVNEVNTAPVLTVPGTQTMDELTTLNVNATATDADLPANLLTFELVSGPGGLTVASSGAIAWTPTQDQSPSTNPVTVRVFDNGTPSLSDTQSFVVIVRPGINDGRTLAWFKIAGGSAGGTAGNRALVGTAGQADAGGPLTNSQFSLVGGFWALPVAVQVPGAPTLTIARAAPGQATISWAPNTPGFVLQETTALSPANWTNSPSGATNPITVTATLPKKFYRLFQP